MMRPGGRSMEISLPKIRHWCKIIFLCFAPVAQGIEQRIPNPCAACSIHAGGTNNIKELPFFVLFNRLYRLG